MSAKAVFLQAIISFASSKATLSPRLKSGKPAFLGLVEIASALGAAEGERPSVFAAEKRESKIIVLFHKFIGVSLRAHENSHHILAPQLAQHTPADGHGVIVALLTGGEQRPVISDKADKAVVDIADVDFFEFHGKSPFLA